MIGETYYLADKTPVIRAKVDPSMIDILSEEDIILKIEETNFFRIDDQQTNFTNFKDTIISDDIIPEELPVVGILDNGVDFGESPLQDFVIAKWQADGTENTNYSHGNGCASQAMFKNSLEPQISEGILRPRVRIVDGIISNGESIPFDVFINRIKEAVKALKTYTKVFNLSFNSKVPIDGVNISIVGYELDCVAKKEKIQFVISAGNHKLYYVYDNLNDILEDSDSQISSPADSVLGLSIGAYCLEDHPKSLSGKYEVAPYSRIGFGLGGIQKPDFVAPGGNAYFNKEENIPITCDNDYVLIPLANGELMPTSSTSFSAPIVAGNFAVLYNSLPDFVEDKILLTKALLINNSDYLFDVSDLNSEENEALRKVYGNGAINLENALYSNNHRVTFVRTGKLNYLTKNRVRFYMPSNMALQEGSRTCLVKVTCVFDVSFDKSKGVDYICAYIGASLKKINTKQELNLGNPSPPSGRFKWSVYQNFQNIFSRFNSGDWQVWLQTRKRWDIEDDYNLKYALVITIEDLTKSNDIYNAIQTEAQNRFLPINQVRIRV
jgi:hypothetical protein